MKLQEYNIENLYAIPLTRTYDQEDNTIYLKKNGFLFRASAMEKLDLKNHKYMHFRADVEDINRAKMIYLLPHNDEDSRDISKNIKSSTINCMDIVRKYPKLSKLCESKDKVKRRLKLHFDKDVNRNETFVLKP